MVEIVRSVLIVWIVRNVMTVRTVQQKMIMTQIDGVSTTGLERSVLPLPQGGLLIWFWSMKKILKKSGIDNEHSIFIGDELRDIEAARKANISSGIVSWGYNKIQKLKEKTPDEVFLNINEILEIA